MPDLPACLECKPLTCAVVTGYAAKVTAEDRAVQRDAFIAAMLWGYGRVGYGPSRVERIMAQPGFEEQLAFDVQAERIVDLRDAEALATLGIDLADAVAPWKPAVEAGEEPSSWAVRRRLEEAGAHGLIDPPRTVPGLWHLTPFRWNGGGAPRVTRVPGGVTAGSGASPRRTR
ncbi:hypothetical protein M3E72_010780 [Micrococcus luteus]|nr:hypothetical protein [Micrococcus luteus]